MSEQIDKILEDIYLIDNDLRREEKQLRQIIGDLLSAKPETQFDEKFSQQLRQEVLEKIQEIENSKLNKNNYFNFLNLNFMNKLYYAGGGLAVIVLLLVAVINFYPRSAPSFSFKSSSIDLRSKISRIDAQAFGSLSGGTLANGVTGVNQEASALSRDLAVGMGGGGGTGMAVADAKIAPGMIMPEMTRYSYNYLGEDFELPATGDVYKKVPQIGPGVELAERLSGDFSLINMGNFQNKVMTNFSISEDREFGYNIYFDLLNSSVSINQNWNKWPQLGADCKDDACYKNLQLKIGDLPEDSEIINIAKQAIADYGIDVSLYGEPKVNNQWRRSYDLSEDKENYYIPDTLSVVFPLLLDGKTISDDYGYTIGINVDVNIRYRKMSAINGMSTSDFQASSYELETDKERIMKFAKQGGLWPSYMPYGAKNEEEITLGTPSFGLMSHWKYDSTTGRGDEYYIPAIIFPVTSQVSDIYFSRQTVSIPLLKEVLDEVENNNNIPTPLYRGPAETVTEPVTIEAPMEAKPVEDLLK